MYEDDHGRDVHAAETGLFKWWPAGNFCPALQ